MTAETQLTVLLRSLDPERQPGTFVYASSSEPRHELDALMRFREAEGWTLVLAREAAEAAAIAFTFPCAWLTLRVHSALHAVGLTAAVATVLADAGIACNAVAAYHHDHLFVPLDRADEAIEILRRLSRS